MQRLHGLMESVSNIDVISALSSTISDLQNDHVQNDFRANFEKISRICTSHSKITSAITILLDSCGTNAQICHSLIQDTGNERVSGTVDDILQGLQQLKSLFKSQTVVIASIKHVAESSIKDHGKSFLSEESPSGMVKQIEIFDSEEEIGVFELNNQGNRNGEIFFFGGGGQLQMEIILLTIKLDSYHDYFHFFRFP